MSVEPLLRFARTTTARLAASYLLIIMVLSIAFSFVIYNVSAHELGRQLPPDSFYNGLQFNAGPPPDFHHFFKKRIDEGRNVLLGRLIILNLLVLVGGAGISYYLARRTLQPIEAAMAAQSRFVTDASHELRTPLTAILTSNEVALRKPGLSLPRAKAVIASNIEEMTKLKDLSDGLLSLAKQDSAVVAHTPVSLQDTASEAMNRLLPAAQAKQITVADNVPDIKVLGDNQGLAQTVAILLDNAIKYSPKKTTIHLSGQAKDGRGYLRVQDEGVGISPADVPRIFDRFYQADVSRTESATAGYGIGLAIAKQIVEQHGGTITVSSTLAAGSTFTLELPLAGL